MKYTRHELSEIAESVDLQCKSHHYLDWIAASGNPGKTAALKPSPLSSTVSSISGLRVQAKLRRGGQTGDLLRMKTLLQSCPPAVRWYGLVLSACFAYFYLALFSSLRVPFLLGGDQEYFWMGAQRLLSGEAIYKDFFQYTPPGTDLVYVIFFKLFGEKIWVTNAVVLTLGVLSACLCFSLSRQLMKNTHALIATGLFVVMIYGMFVNATNHWFAVLVILLAVRVIMERLTDRRVALSGVLLALASFFNHAHGAAALGGFVAFIVLSGMRKHDASMNVVKTTAILISTFALAALCLSAYYLSTVGFTRLWFCLVASVFRNVAQAPRSLGLPGRPGEARLLPYEAVYLLLPLIYSFAFWKCWRSRRDPLFPWNQVMLPCLIGLLLLLEVAMNVNVVRLFAIAMPGIVLLVWAVGRLRFPTRALFIGASIAIVALGLHQIVKRHLICNS